MIGSNHISTLIALICGLSFGLVLSQSVQAQSQSDLKALIDRRTALQNVSVHFTTTITHRSHPGSLREPGRVSMDGTYRFDVLFRYLDGMAYYDRKLDEASRTRLKRDLSIDYPSRDVLVITHERAEQLI